jgi:hypothetical protein
MDKKDMISFFQELRIILSKSDKTDFLLDSENVNYIENMFEGYDISKLDIKRIYRYLDKNIKRDQLIEEE